MLRVTLDLTQETMAQELGISRQHYLSIETGKKEISRKLLTKLYQKWGVDEQYFMSENDYSIHELKGVIKGGNKGGNNNLPPNSKAISAELLDNEKDQDNKFKKITQDFLKRLYESPNWSKSQKLKLELYDKYKSKDRDAISAFKAYRDLTAKVLKFINSIDAIFDEHIERKLFDDLNAGKSETEILKTFEADLNNIAEIEPILNDLNSHLENSIDRLKPFDKHSELLSNGEDEYYQHLLAQEYEVVKKLKDKIKIYKKYLL